MKKLLAVLVLTIAAALASTAGAQASCHSFGCVNRQIKALTARARRDEKALRAVVGCFGEVPATQYGDSAGSFGYVFDTGGGSLMDTTALDATNSGDTVGAWLLTDGCNTTVTAAVRAAHVARPSGPSSPLAPQVPLLAAAQDK